MRARALFARFIVGIAERTMPDREAATTEEYSAPDLYLDDKPLLVGGDMKLD